MPYSIYPKDLSSGIYKRFVNQNRKCLLCNKSISDNDEMHYFVRSIGKFKEYRFIHTLCIFLYSPPNNSLTEEEIYGEEEE